ncbi:MAG: TonB family protein [Polyangiaceae bacterium]
MQLEPGTRVNDRLRLVRPLGRGGMGAVWVAHHETLDIEVAVKFIVADDGVGSPSRAALVRFRREAQLAARLDSPNVVRMLDHGILKGDHEEVPYIVMELLRGESVAERLARARRVPPAEVVRIVGDVADGLERAHELGVVHRDIKPQNLFLTLPKDVVKVLDFGIARAEAVAPETDESGGAAAGNDTATSTGAIVGTPHYMSPEQLLEAATPDKSADVWALAVVAYELLTGKRPFGGETPARTMMMITQAKFDRATRAGALPPEIDAFFERAFAIERARRFPTARALADALRVALANAPADPRGDSAHASSMPRAPAEPSAAPGALEPAVGTAEFVRSAGLEVATDPASSPPPEPAPTHASAVVAPATRRAFPGFAIAAGLAVVSVAAGASILVFRSGASPSTPAAASSRPLDAALPVTASAATPMPLASSASPAAPLVLLPCEANVRAHCVDPARPWCNQDGEVVSCCAMGLVPVGRDRCGCPKGGTDVEKLVESGCQGAKPDEGKNARTHMRSRFGELRACYEAALARNPRIQGELALRVEVDPNGAVGRVTFANASAPDPDFQDCTLRVVQGVQFDPPVNGSLVFTYPLSFSPGN